MRGLVQEKLHKNDQGFSLIELIIAVVILAILVIPVSRALITAADLNLKGRKQEIANSVAENVMEALKQVDYDKYPVSGGAPLALNGFSETLSPVAGTTDCYQLVSTSLDAFTFDVWVKVDDSAYSTINTDELSTISSINPTKDYIYAQKDTADKNAKQAIANAKGVDIGTLTNKISRTITLDLSKGVNPAGKDIYKAYVSYQYDYENGGATYTYIDDTTKGSGNMLVPGATDRKINVYLCFYPYYEAAANKDMITIQAASDVDLSQINLYVVKLADTSKMNLSALEIGHIMKLKVTGTSASNVLIYSNLKKNLYDSLPFASGVNPVTIDNSAGTLGVTLMDDAPSEAMTRMYATEVKVYPKDSATNFDSSGCTTEEPLAALSSELP